MHDLETAERLTKEDAARRHIEAMRWRDDVTCPWCFWSGVPSQRTAGAFICEDEDADCRREFTVRSRVFLAQSYLPLHKWLSAIALIAASEHEVRPAHLLQHLKLGSYHTAQRVHRLLKDAQASGGPSGQLLRALIAYEQKQQARSGREPRRRPPPSDWDPRSTSRKRTGALQQHVTAAEAAQRLGLIEDVVALSRVPQASALFRCVDDTTRVVLQTLPNLEKFVPEPSFRDLLSKHCSRSAERPLPASAWWDLRDAAEAFSSEKENTARSRLGVYAYLHEVCAVMQRHYRKAGSIARYRLGRRGLQMALWETSTLSADRCNRYAHAIRLVLTSRRYDGSGKSFENILRHHGGLHRAVRSERSTTKRRAVGSRSVVRMTDPENG